MHVHPRHTGQTDSTSHKNLLVILECSCVRRAPGSSLLFSHTSCGGRRQQGSAFTGRCSWGRLIGSSCTNRGHLIFHGRRRRNTRVESKVVEFGVDGQSMSVRPVRVR